MDRNKGTDLRILVLQRNISLFNTWLKFYLLNLFWGIWEYLLLDEYLLQSMKIERPLSSTLSLIWGSQNHLTKTQHWSIVLSSFHWASPSSSVRLPVTVSGTWNEGSGLKRVPKDKGAMKCLSVKKEICISVEFQSQHKKCPVKF